jgi:Abortive infection C-terminus
MSPLPPLNEAVSFAVAQLFADDPVNRRDPDAHPRDPSHQALNECFQRTELSQADIRAGKEKRVRAVLSWALDNDVDRGRRLVAILISTARGCGGFRPDSPNYVGDEAMRNAQSVLRSEGWVLASDGDLAPAVVTDELAGPEVTDALASYVRRAARGGEDDALVIGTSKDLVEATAAHVLVEKWGSYSTSASFETLLGQAFVAVGLAVPGDHEVAGEPARKKLERGLFAAALGVNKLRNKAGTGHGRPFLPDVGPIEARLAVKTMGCVAELLLDALRAPRT